MHRSWEYYDEIASKYDYMYEEPYWVLYHMLLELLISDQRINGRILDLGTGTGRWAIDLAKKGMNVVAIDPSEKMLSVAKMKAHLNEVKIDFMKAKGEALPFEKDYFDAVLAMGDVISYCDSPMKLLSEVNRVLKPEGKLVATVDNAFAFLQDFVSNVESKNAEKFMRNKRVLIGDSSVSRIHFHTTPFFPDDIKVLLSKTGFKLIDIAGMVVFAPYDEEKLARNIDDALAWEYRFCREEQLFGRAEHLFFAAAKG
ncbi:class I SAM-dependent methyltransferase [Kosmotoga arenicorallina]|uniref:class I SAM-dependent methyltransferase n=1 Tax=Kosmotoga arenicorallina TaxID=688066 RepID=UPI000A0040C2|nr:class I SAM-dependent methyltransferase [Kosmotoga arenicorallina]